MQISYHSALTKIQKLQNFYKKMNKKNKNKNFFFVPAGMPSTNRYTQNPPVHPVHSQYAWYLNQYETLAFQN